MFDDTCECDPDLDVYELFTLHCAEMPSESLVPMNTPSDYQPTQVCSTELRAGSLQSACMPAFFQQECNEGKRPRACVDALPGNASISHQPKS